MGMGHSSKLAVVLLLCLLSQASSFVTHEKKRGQGSSITFRSKSTDEIELVGTQSPRTKLITWYLYENDKRFQESNPAWVPSGSPFGQVPFLKDGKVEIFETAAILQYLSDKCGQHEGDDAGIRAQSNQWTMFAATSLDPIVFTPADKGGGARAPRLLGQLDGLLSESGSGYLVGNKLTVADIAVGGTLSLLPQVAPTTGLGPWKALAGYVLRLARRPAYRRAFGLNISHTPSPSSSNPTTIITETEGDETTDLVLEKFEGFLAEEVAPPKEKPPGYGAFMKLFEAIADPFFKYIYSADGR